MTPMCSLQIAVYNKTRDGKEYYQELAETVDENKQIQEEMQKRICDQHLRTTPYND